MVIRANIHILLIEELIDLLYEMNDVFNLLREVDTKYGEHLHYRLTKALFHIAFAAEQASKETQNPRETNEFLRDTFSTTPAEGYVDRSDLAYALEKVVIHLQRMKMAYTPELEEPLITLLEIAELYLKETNYFIYGRTTDSVSDPDRTGQPKGNLQFAD
jgi:hypothetical protein